MSIPETRGLFSTIEGVRHLAEIATANNTVQFKRAISGVSAVVTLTTMTSHFPEKSVYQGQVAHRTAELLAERHDLQYANPNDTAIATYLHVLLESHSPYALGLAAATYALPNLWWARKIAFEIMTGQVFHAV